MTDQSQSPPRAQTTVRLSDYAPYPYQVEEIALVFDLVTGATRVQATMKFAAVHDRAKGVKALVLKGEHMKLLTIALDGVPLGPGDYIVTDSELTIAVPPARFTLTTEVEIDPQ